MFAPSRCLDIGLVPFCEFMDLDFVSLVNTLVLIRHGEFFFLLWNCDKQNEMQLLAEFKQILYMGSELP